MLLSARMKAVRKELKCQIVPCNLKDLVWLSNHNS